ncbi:hypothetical protein Pla22_34370 [Rubripirellula amarantea]|uniref:Uncharacterized protein n=1 Tax=Rubripirellula amarantea TaxID=2527999 RepID=A0A5C5WIP6_9BACT|nr:hypothetical protein [Rubripirellula amarantea]TWT50694.1 hypothetical protein Pla22_34370 [Rubripirellula amarantea]
MTNSQRLATVRAALTAWILNHGDLDDQESVGEIINESILIRDEFYCGRRFRTDTHRAVWFIEEDQLKIYQTDDTLCATLGSEEITSMAELADDINDMPNVIRMPQPMENSPSTNEDEASERKAA